MPSGWLSVPHFQQEFEYSCVAACVRMVLAHYGDVRIEAELRLFLDTQPTGTRAGNVMRLSAVRKGDANISRMQLRRKQHEHFSQVIWLSLQAGAEGADTDSRSKLRTVGCCAQ